MKTFESRITRMPRAFDRERGAETVAALPAMSGQLAELVAGASGSSPHLAEVCRREGRWLTDAMQGSPEVALENLLREPVEDVARDLRSKKTRAAGLIALSDLAGVWSLEETTGNLTRFADYTVETALQAAIGAQIRRGKLPGQTEDDVVEAAGLSVIAMGKMGAFELNYSSDIDLICLYDETRFDPADYAEARAGFVKAVRSLCQLLSDRTSDGYVFRTDLRLRPDASVTPVAISMEAAERYYESFGRTWERAAFIKARVAAGDKATGRRFLKALTPFVWRRHLDYAAIQDAQDMRLRIRDHKKLVRPISHLGHDMKLGQGGIREIELFTQTRQIIAGGRDPDLRDPTTIGGLARLAEKGWVSPEDAASLTVDYCSHRETEHRIQMIADQQTHDLPDTEEDFARLSALCGVAPETLAKEIEERLHRVAGMTEGFFQPSASTGPVSTEILPTKDLLSRWAGYPALRSPRAVEILTRVWPLLKERIDAAGNPKEALTHFEGFLSGLPAGVQLFSLFEANPQLLDLVIDIVDTAPELGQYLSRNSAVFDAVLGGQFFDDWPGEAALADRLSRAMQAEPDYEKRLDRARSWAREWHFRVGVHFLRGLANAEAAGRQYADLAGAVVIALWPVVVEEFARKHGPPPGRGAGVVAMGSLGAGRLSTTSDLDLIVVYDAGSVEMSEGARPLATRPYFARLTQALVTALSAPMAEGRLYQVDMRLRPSGRQGPVATSLAAFTAYQTKEAWTWEHLALTRARPIVGERTLIEDIETVRSDILRAPRDAASVLRDVADMRARLHDAKQARHWLDVGVGRGGLQDIDLLVQAATLLSGGGARPVSEQINVISVLNVDASDLAILKAAQALFWTLRTASRLVFGDAVPSEIGAGAASLFQRASGLESIASIEAEVAKSRDAIAEIVTGVFPN